MATAALAAALLAGLARRAAAAERVTLLVVADKDDDDADGRPDGEQEWVPPAARADLVPLPATFAGVTLRPTGPGAGTVRVLVDGKPVDWHRPLPRGALVQGVTPGVFRAAAVRGATEATLVVEVRRVGLRDGSGGLVDLTRSHGSIARTPPARIDASPDARYDDPDALRAFIALPGGDENLSPVPPIGVDSYAANGALLDELTPLALAAVPCPPEHDGMRCLQSAPLRFVIDDVDRMHPLVQDRSLRAEVGGAIVLESEGRKLQALRISGPRSSPVGPIGRLRATVRSTVLRVAAGGAPAIGGSDAGAVAALRAELALASAIWGQCGLTFGDARTLDVHIVDPPPPHLLAIGDDLGLPAGGGELRVRVDERTVVVRIAAGAFPSRAAHETARAIEKAGFVAIVSPNARIAPGVTGSVDVSVRRKNGTLAWLDVPPSGELVTDSTLAVRIGSVDLTDGLQHFQDMDAMAGTLEERTLLKAIEDADPRTIDLVIVPSFAGGVRIGESFIGSDASSLRNVVIMDRAGVRSRRSSLTLAHELGHVLLDVPDHPDDYGLDTPTLLMDSDASDASPFGPRRLTLDECARVVRQSGPGARLPLLAPWPLGPLVYPPRPGR